MTEDQIERRFESMINGLDRRYLAGQLTTEQYHQQYRKLARWADDQYSALTESDWDGMDLDTD